MRPFGNRRTLKDVGKRVLHRVFVAGQRVGVDILPRHFYSGIPCIKELRRTTHWRRPLTMRGVRGADLDQQLEFARSCCPDDLVARQLTGDIHRVACERNGAEGFGQIEGEFLHCFVATRMPQTIVQVGCGVSTAVCLEAAREAGYAPRVMCIEPYPTDFLRQAHARGQVELIEAKVETCLPDLSAELVSGDLFFVDSTHVLGPAGEVTRLILEVLPGLPSGAWAHFHDIVFPYDYPGRILTESLFFSHETTLLHAFLAFNARFQIDVSLSMLHFGRAEQLRSCLPNYRRVPSEDGLLMGEGHYPSSIYLRAVDSGG